MYDSAIDLVRFHLDSQFRNVAILIVDEINISGIILEAQNVVYT